MPANKLVVIAAHAPFIHYRGVGTQNAAALFDTLTAAGRTAENTVLVGGHTHTIENLRAGDKREEWAAKGISELPFPQLVAGAVSGDWYSGSLDEYGLPNAYGIGGNRPGTLTLALAGNSYVESYQRQEPWSMRMALGLNSPAWREWAPAALAWRADTSPTKAAAPAFGDLNVVTDEDLKGGTFISTNFYLGSTDATVEMSLDGRAPVVATHTQPGTGEATRTGWEFADVASATANLLSSGNVAQNSSSIWRAPLPAQLSWGTHTAKVTATDRHGRVYSETIRFTVVDERAAN